MLLLLGFLNFILTFWFMLENDLTRKLKLISKLMTSQSVKQTITIHIFPNISRIKSNPTMKLDQLIEYNMRNIFLEKLQTKCFGEPSPRPFYRKHIWIISLNCYTIFFNCLSKLWFSKNIKYEVQATFRK